MCICVNNEINKFRRCQRVKVLRKNIFHFNKVQESVLSVHNMTSCFPWSQRMEPFFFLSPGISQMCSWSCLDLDLSHFLHRGKNLRGVQRATGLTQNSWFLLKLLSDLPVSPPQRHQTADLSSVLLRLKSQDVAFGEVELLVRHPEVPQVPEYPEDEAEEDQQRPGQHEEVPEAQRCEDPEEEEDEADDVHDHSQREEEGGGLPLLHGRAGWVGRRLEVWQERVSRVKCSPVMWIALFHASHFPHSSRLSGKTGIQPQWRAELQLAVTRSIFIPVQDRLVLHLSWH